MRVLVPLNNIEHIDEYIKAGASEFYIGFYDEAWHKKFGEYADINRLTGFKKDANPYCFEEMIKVINEVKEKNIMVYVTFNASLYSEEQLDYIRRYWEILKQTKVDGVIVSTLEQVKLAKEVGIESVVSTIAGVYNSDIAKIYYNAGAKRIILPRDLSVNEIEKIIEKVPESEYEVFMMRNGCKFSDANCLGFHRSEQSSICSYIGHAECELVSKNENFEVRHDNQLNDMIYNHSFHNFTCGLCSIYRFVKAGVTAGKIVGRSDEWQNVCQDIEYIKQNVDIAKNCKSEEEYLEKMIFPRDNVTMCKLGLSCYYPEIRFGKKNKVHI